MGEVEMTGWRRRSEWRPSARAWAMRGALALFVLFAAGCGPGYLDAGKKVPATPENRAIHNVLVSYHKAMEDRDVSALRKLISKRYYENGGTTDTDKDDYGIDRLEAEVLPKLQANVKRVQFRIRLLAIAIDGDNANAEFEYVGRALLTEGGKESYKMWNDFAQMKLLREDGAWKIAEGL